MRVSFDSPEFTGDLDALGTMRLLEAIRLTGVKTRFYQASTSELYGKVQEVPQKETTPFYPRSPYGVAKCCSFWAAKNCRDAYGLHASNGIPFNYDKKRSIVMDWTGFIGSMLALHRVHDMEAAVREVDKFTLARNL